jgi:hypothetical protein
MGLQGADSSESRFEAYVQGLVSVIGHADRAGPLRDYCLGLVMPCERKSVEPIAAITAPERTAAQHQALLHFVGQSPWSDQRVLAMVCEMVLGGCRRPALVRSPSRFFHRFDFLALRDDSVGHQQEKVFGTRTGSGSQSAANKERTVSTGITTTRSPRGEGRKPQRR